MQENHARQVNSSLLPSPSLWETLSSYETQERHDTDNIWQKLMIATCENIHSDGMQWTYNTKR